jgi:hypothetical protein
MSAKLWPLDKKSITEYWKGITLFLPLLKGGLG